MRKNTFIKVVPLILGILVLLSSCVVSPLSIGLGMPKQVAIIKFNSDYAVDTAVEILKNEFPRATVVNYNSIESLLLKFSPIGSLIFVGHGTNDGIAINQDKTLSWEKYADIVNDYNVQVYFLLNCKSDQINPYIAKEDSDRIITLNDDIDATLGALLTSMVIHATLDDKVKVSNCANKVSSRLTTLESNMDSYAPLAALYEKEIAYWIVEVAITVLMTIVFSFLAWVLSLVGSALWARISARYLSKTVSAGKLGLFTSIKAALIDFKAGHITASYVLITIGRWLVWSPSRLTAAISESMSILDFLIWGAAFAAGLIAALALAVLTDGANFAITVGLLTGDLIRCAAGLYLDFDDSNSEPRYSLGILPESIFEDIAYPLIRGDLDYLEDISSSGGGGGGGGGGGYYY